MAFNQYFYELAKVSAKKAAENGVTVDPKWIYSQWYIETEGFTSQAQAQHHNLGGILNHAGQAVHFNSFVDFANYFGKYLSYYKEDGISHAHNLYAYLAALHHGGYFSVDVNTYYQTCLHIISSIPF